MLSYGFRFYESNKLYRMGESLNLSRIWMGSTENISLGLENDLHVTIPRGQYKKLEAVVDVNAEIEAPIKKGQQ